MWGACPAIFFLKKLANLCRHHCELRSVVQCSRVVWYGEVWYSDVKYREAWSCVVTCSIIGSVVSSLISGF